MLNLNVVHILNDLYIFKYFAYIYCISVYEAHIHMSRYTVIDLQLWGVAAKI